LVRLHFSRVIATVVHAYRGTHAVEKDVFKQLDFVLIALDFEQLLELLL
jgi:hypothetical protein